MAEKEIGVVSDFFAKINVAAIKMTGSLKVGNSIHIKGHTTDFEQTVDSMQVHNQSVEEAKKGDEIGIKINSLVRRNDEVYIIIKNK